ncbi:hypothetical protein TNCV_246171, partial [Trichonephila clavipes]
LKRHLKLHEVSRAKILENKRKRLNSSPQPGPSGYQTPAAKDRRDNIKSRTCLNTFETYTISTDLNFIKNLNGFLQILKKKLRKQSIWLGNVATFLTYTRLLLTDEDVNFMNVPDDSEIGYIFEVDLEYPDELHDLHNCYPLAPEKLKKVHINPGVLIAHAKALEKATAKYPIDRVNCKVFSMTLNRAILLSKTTCFPDKCHKRIVYSLCE